MLENETPAAPAVPETSAESFEAFFDRLLPRAVRVGARICGTRADGEDAAVEGLARAYADWTRLSGLDHREAWVLRVTANVAYDHVRREASRTRVEGPAMAQRESTEVVDMRRTLVPALRRLSRRQREVVILSYVAELSQPEIAEAIGCSLGSVKVHARRGLEKLRNELGADVILEES